MDSNKQQALQQQTTQFSTQHSALVSTGRHEWSDQATEKEIDAAISDIQWAKGKFYSQVIARLTEKMPAEEFEKRTMAHLEGMISAIKRLQVSREELEVITRRAKQAEFTGTTFMPLPTEYDLVKITREVQGEMLQKRINHSADLLQLPPAGTERYEGKTADEMWDLVLEKFGVTKQEQK